MTSFFSDTSLSATSWSQPSSFAQGRFPRGVGHLAAGKRGFDDRRLREERGHDWGEQRVILCGGSLPKKWEHIFMCKYRAHSGVCGTVLLYGKCTGFHFGQTLRNSAR